MIVHWRPLAWGVLLASVTAVAALASYYHQRYQQAERRGDIQQQLAQQRQAALDDMQKRQRAVSALDAKYSGELANAQTTINRLQADVAAGRKRLQLNATCSKSPAAPAPGVDDAASPRLTPDARQNYFRLREQLATSEKQIRGLQDYIRKVVFDEKGESNQ